MKKAVLITILIAIGLIVAGGAMSFVSLAAAGFDIKNLFNISVSGADLNTVDITEDYTDLELKIDSDSIEIFKSSDENTHFTYYATDVHDYDVKVEENTLKIESLDKSASIKDIFVFHFQSEGSKLYLPKEEYDNFTAEVGSGSFSSKEEFKFDDVELDVGSGSIKLAKMTAKDLNAKTASGSVHADSCNGTEMSLTSGSGSVELNDITSDGKVQVKSSSGSVKAYNVTAKTVELKAGSGSVTTENVTCEEDFQVQSSSGSLNFTNTVSGNKFEGKSGSGSIHLDSCDGADMNLQASSGSIKGTVKTVKMFNGTSGSGSVKVPDDDPNGGKCVLHTGSGSIKISIDGMEETEADD